MIVDHNEWLSLSTGKWIMNFLTAAFRMQPTLHWGLPVLSSRPAATLGENVVVA